MCPATAKTDIPIGDAILGGGRVPVQAIARADRKTLDEALDARLAQELARIGGRLGKELSDDLAKAKVDAAEHRGRTLRETAIAVLEKARGRKLTKAQRERLDSAVRGARESRQTVAELLDLDAPLGQHPALKAELTALRTQEIARAAGLADAKAAALAKAGLDLESLTAPQLDDLVARKVVTAGEGRELRFLGEVSRISGANMALLGALKGGGHHSVSELATWEPDDWKALIDGHGVPLPDGEDDSGSYADSLTRVVEASYPNEFLVARAVAPAFREEVEAVKDVAARRIDGAELVGEREIHADAIDWRGLGGAEKRALEKKLGRLARFANTYRGLGVREVVNDANLSPAEKAGAIDKRLEGMRRFLEKNPGLDLYVADFVDKRIRFDWSGIDASLRGPVKAQMQAMQRMLTLTDSPTKTMQLMEKGYASSVDIAEVSQATFMQDTGLDHFDAPTLYARAYENSISITHLFEGIRDASHGLFDKLKASNSAPLVNDLRDIDGYAALFGEQNYCNCAHCRSLLSPSAYFFDLMRFIAEHVSDRLFVPSMTDHPLYLKRRRPDLWTLDLSCRSAKTELPYLQVVNEVLGGFIESELGVADVNATLAAAQNSVILPINLDLEEMRLYIEDFSIPLARVHRLLDRPEHEWRREYLRLAPEELALIATPDPGGVGARFGNLPVGGMDLQDFIKFSGLSRAEVSELLSVGAFVEIGKVGVQVIQKPEDIQLYQERLKNLTNSRLDLIHRFIRLVRGIGWTIPETDLLMSSLQAAGLITTLQSKDAGGRPNLLVLAPLFEVASALGLGREETVAMVGPLPGRPLTEGGRSLYDRVFDRTAIFGVAGTAADGSPVYNGAATLLADRSQDRTSALVAGGLGITEVELRELLVELGEDVTVDITVDDALLVRLFRLARLARGLKLSVADLIGAIGLELGGGPVATLADMQALVRFAEWRRGARIAVDELRLIIAGAEGPTAKFAATPAAAAAMVQAVQASEETDKPALLAGALAERFNLTVDRLTGAFLGRLTALDLAGPGIATALGAGFTGGVADNPAELDALLALMRQLERATRLIAALRLSDGVVDAVAADGAPWGIAHPATLSLANVRALAQHAALARLKPELEPRLLKMLAAYEAAGHFASEDKALLSDLLEESQELIQSVIDVLMLPGTAIAAVGRVSEAVAVAATLGIDGHSLAKLTATGAAGLADARNVLHGAIQARHQEGEGSAEALSRFAEAMNERRRDALTAFIIGHHATFKFKDRADLYEFFLLDTEMGGCFMTSRVIAAISSLQTYINRCLMNLEQSSPILNPAIPDVKVDPTWIPKEEWHWRRNYRVWEANRKIFLYPENYIDPALRDDKSHLFVALEDELLQQKITMESAETAYKHYLAGFAELARLRYAGAFAKSPSPFWQVLALDVFKNQGASLFKLNDDILDKTVTDADYATRGKPKFFLSDGSDGRVYYLFARTNRDPYQYYYRIYRRKGAVWGNWIKMDVPVEAETISAAMHRGRLYVFWNDIKYKEVNKIKDGNSEGGSVNFEITTKYASLNEDGTWTAVQKMPLGALWSPRDDIYYRTIGYYPADEDEQDRLKDEVFAAYVREVFSKPYATVTGQSGSPLDLAYVWSQEQGVQDIVYQTGSFNVSVGIFKISSPGVSFTVTNNQFGQIKDVAVTIKAPLATIDMTAKAMIQSPAHCLVDMGGIISIALPLTASTVQSNVFTTVTGMSLSQSRILDHAPVPINERSSYQSIGHSSRSYLMPELNLSGGAATAFHVENNHTTFTTSGRVVTQQPWGDATLTLPKDIGGIEVVPLTTILTDELAETLYEKGLEDFISLGTQMMKDTVGQGLDFHGPYGRYYWELFFHIPYLIGSHCNANQKFAEARWWYERIFNPTSPESPADVKPSDHNWRFREFRGVDIEKLKDILVNQEAIEAYRKDPFDPHAIAGLRRSAYMKAIVMAYVDNLIDWADSLFAQDTRESITEALILYTFARAVLGERPVQVGECKSVDPLNYEIILGKLKDGSEFLLMLENLVINRKNSQEFAIRTLLADKQLDAVLAGGKAGSRDTALETIRTKAKAHVLSDRITETRRAFADDTRTQVRFEDGTVMTAKQAVESDRLSFDTKYGMPALRYTADDVPAFSYEETKRGRATPANAIAKTLDVSRAVLNDHLALRPDIRLPALELTRHNIAAFCVPHNEDLLDFWGRIDRQLFKIRHCQNIDGVRRSLALTQPPIDPMMLVRARAAGLSLEDVAALVAGAAQVPPYRFAAMLQVARQAAQMVKEFGQLLLAAMEKKDVEELRRLQLTHERNIQGLTRTVKLRQVRESRELGAAANAALGKAEERLEHLTALIEGGLNGWEIMEQAATHTASLLKVSESVVHLVAGLTYLFPQVGSPFAMKYGGKELGDSGVEFALWTSALAGVAMQLAQSARLEAGHQRREEEWKHQRRVARDEVRELTARAAAAEIRVAVAEKDLEIHERAMEQTAEVEDFHKEKFTGLALYNHLSATLNRVYRRAYGIAHDLARQAEQAYQFETDRTDVFIASDNWDAARAGLLAGEHLTVQLAALESAYLAANERRPEIRQAFSLAMLDGGELLRLRQTGACTIRIPEIAFEVLYPGQYRRTIKSVRVSVPAVVGPYTNVSARLTLLKGEIEPDDLQPLVERPAGKNDSITLSGAVNDSGTFEFAYRDERYLPFEGAGAVSEWRLELPDAIRSFNYDTISDVVLQLEYTALDGDRAAAEAQLGADLTAHAAAEGMFRLISLRHEMPDAWHRLAGAPPAAPRDLDFVLEDAHFPHLFRGRDLQIAAVRVFLQPKWGASVTPPPLSLNGTGVSWSSAEDIALPGATGETGKLKGGTVGLSGPAKRSWTFDGGAGGLDGLDAEDLLVLLRYKVTFN